MRPILIRGTNEVGSGVAHLLFLEGFAVILHDEPYRSTNRRTAAFSDAAIDGEASLAGVRAPRVDDFPTLSATLAAHVNVPVLVQPLPQILDYAGPAVLIDARMRKQAQPEA